MSKLVSCSATILAELNISMGAPTVNDIVTLINKKKYTIEVYEPLTGDLSIVLREVKPRRGNKNE
jgi:hypothetical protein